ncbi:hypothetical protein MGL_1070 [Malassezia globosa CBS 7966]|uniref:RRM domain-containing protein n=1 Tax=Malassezia globosa (strain ATCC MYA-4612 / CBS 7966) TaxID=425265 RepID=A8PWC8_MALGO|nr:uncharacterized protein MGL_1070 [Malassezia globosa CBS 7966]EDP44588.1 hypothetical protein MGL_1070 [Malassezia globosa CBS 7966]
MSEEPGMRESSRWGERRSSVTQPSRDVILLGLDPDIDAEKLRTLVTALANMVDARLAAPPQDATVIRDRNTGVSKGFGFVKFDTLEDAKRFVYMHAPYILHPETWLGPAPGLSQKRKRVKIDFSNSERPQGGISYYEQHNAPDSKDQLKRARARRAKSAAANGGLSDDMAEFIGSSHGTSRSSSICSGSSATLEHANVQQQQHKQVDSANENAGMRDASCYPTDMLLLAHVRLSASVRDVGMALAQATTGLEQVLLLRERVSRASTGQAFAIYTNVEAAKAALCMLRNKQELPHGILGSTDTEPVKTSYADSVILDEADPFDPTNAAYVYTDRRGDTWRYEDESLGFDSWKPEEMPMQTTIKSTVNTAASIETPLASSAHSSFSLDSVKPTVILPPLVASGGAPTATPEPVVANGTTYFIPKVALPTPAPVPAPTPTTPAPASMPMPPLPQHAVLRLLNFSDATRRICVLCQRQFRSSDMLERHVSESALHQANLNDETACQGGAARLLAMSSLPAAEDSKENAAAPSLPPTAPISYTKETPQTNALFARRPALRQMRSSNTLDSWNKTGMWTATPSSATPFASWESGYTRRPMTTTLL